MKRPPMNHHMLQAKPAFCNFLTSCLGCWPFFSMWVLRPFPWLPLLTLPRPPSGMWTTCNRYAKFVTMGLVAGYIFGVIAIPRFISQTKGPDRICSTGYSLHPAAHLPAPEICFLCLAAGQFLQLTHVAGHLAPGHEGPG